MNKTFIFVLFTLFISFCFAGEEQAIDQVTDNKIRIENIEKQQVKLSNRIDDKSKQLKEYTDKEIKEEIEILLNDRNDVLCMREKWIDWVMLFVTILVAFLGVGVTLYLYIKSRKQSKEFEEQKAKISKILREAEEEKKLSQRESEIIQRFSRRRRKELEKIIEETESKKKEFEGFVDNAKSTLYELVKDTLVKDKKISKQVATIINDILTEKEESNFDANDWKIKGNEFRIKKDYSKVIYCYTKAIELNFNDSDGYINRGVAYLRNKKYDKALNDFNRAIEISPKSHLAYFNLGIVKVHKKEYLDAFDAYERAISLKPKYCDIYMNLLELAIIDNKESIWKKYSESISKIHLNYENMGMLLLLKSIAELYFYNKEFKISVVKLEIDSLIKKYLEKIEWSFDELTEWINKTSFKKSHYKVMIEDMIIFVKEAIEKHNNLFETK